MAMALFYIYFYSEIAVANPTNLFSNGDAI